MTCKIKTKHLRWLAAMLMLVAAMVMPSTSWAQEMYTVFDTSSGTLTFKYDNNKPESTDDQKVYDVPATSTTPGWRTNDAASIKTVVFDASFANARPTTCYQWFSNCKALTEIQDIKNLNTSEVTDMMYMFQICSQLTSLDLSSFNTAKVTNMRRMFYNCSGLTYLDLSSFDTSNVTIMISMFESCSQLATIYVSDKFTTDNVTNSADMFTNCSELVGSIKYNSTKTDKTRANYLAGYLNTYYKVNGTQTDLCGKSSDKYDSDNNAYNVSSLNFTDGAIVTNVPLNVSGSISYTRTMTNEWGTLCLPFDVTYTSNESYKLYSLTSATESTLTFTEYADGTSISAGTPMAVKRISETTDNSVTISTTGGLVKTSLNNPESDEAWRLVGTYRTVDVPDEGYIISQNAFWNVKGLKDEGQGIRRVKVNGYRAYIMPQSATSEAPAGAAARMLSIAVPDSDTTAIDDINAVFGGEATYYDTNGRRIQSLRQGVNIVKIGNKTKKVIIK